MAKKIPGTKNLKRNRKIRKSVAALLMVTALIFAAIPVPQVEAIATISVVNSIPDVSGKIVYFDETKTFGVAYMNTGSTTKYGVLVYYGGGTIASSSLTIPDSIEAYDYDSVTGIYYPVYEDGSGNVLRLPDYSVTTNGVTTTTKCTLSNRATWITYYTATNSIHPLTISIKYVNDETYIPATKAYDTTTGVFQGQTNFLSLTIPANIEGIGKNAFNGCKVSSITFNNGLEVIEDYAFKECTNLSSVTFSGTSSSLKKIGQQAFYDCRSLASIIIPSSVDTIGDSAFENCYSLATVNLYGQTNSSISTSLTQIGNYAFKNCEAIKEFLMPDYGLTTIGDGILTNCKALETVKFGNDYASAIPKGMFTGCSSLYHLIIPNASTTFADDYEISAYNLGALSDDFYIEGVDSSAAHTYCKLAETGTSAVKVALAFKDLSGTVYEKQVNGYLYIVDNSNNLISLTEVSGATASQLANVDIPASVGGYKITNIDANSFWHNTKITSVTVPSSIKTIATNAFSECTNLTKVYFTEPVNITSIGADAFKTGSSSLTFYGTISSSSVPFQYAMDPANNFNLSSQPIQYIKFYSTFPTSLLVQYNATTGLNELSSYPSYTSYKNGSNPLATAAQNAIAISAIDKYEKQLAGTALPTAITEEEQQVIDAVLNINLPTGIESFSQSTFQNNSDLLSITMNSVTSIPSEAFKNCSKLKTVNLLSSGVTGGESVGDYAFDNCDSLTDVSMATSVSSLGLLPFVNCAKLTTVNFNSGTNYVCTTGIIYQLTSGVKTKIIECLETRGSTGASTVGSSTVAKTELSTVTSIADEAFKNCDGVGDVDLSTSKVTVIPTSCFEDTSSLYSVELPSTCTTIKKDAFLNSSIRNLTIPASVTYIDSDAFNTTTGGVDKPNTNITISCAKGSAAETFANTYGLTIGDILLPTFDVMFFDYNSTILNEQTVTQGSDAVPPANPKRTGYTFTGWTPSYLAVSRDLSVVAQYEKDTTTTYTVIFYDYTGTVLATKTVRSGEDAVPPDNPVRAGYTFTGWTPTYRTITKDTSCIAQYTAGTTTATTGTKYALTVTNGSGGGSIASGTSVTITANAPTSGNVFDKWTTTATDVTFANASSGSTTITMPAHDTTVTPTYKKSTTADASTTGTTTGTTGTTTGTTGTTTGTTGTTTGTTGATTGTGTTGSTTVIPSSDVTNNIGNSNLISASVDGSTDNFVVKISETADATAAVEAALKNQYGSLDNLAYYAMDISLYDSTGATKITDTTGLSVNITVPIPSDLLTYAGNNNAASVKDSKLEDLSEKFTTIDGVSCVTFTATHFSPYTIYVDTANLSAGISDSSPKTGDFIQTKWLLVLGLASISVILFLKRDKEEKIILA